MKFCPTCGDVYPAQAVECRAHGAVLRAWAGSTESFPDGFPDGHTDVEVSRPADPISQAIAAADEEEDRLAEWQPGPTPPAQITPEAMARAGQPHGGRILSGRYRLDRQIGIGGYGAVFDSYDLRLRKRVAVKVLSPALAHSGEVIERFRREAIAASQVRHEGIVDVTDFDQDTDGTHFIVMEYLGGSDLGDVLDAYGSLEPERALEIAAQCASALAAAHEAGIIHRDLKPANIFLTSSRSRADIVKIIDFGISKLTRKIAAGADLTSASKVLGTPAYMSPEQACGKELDGRTDVYALGIILFAMLTGKLPFRGQSTLEILTKHLNEPRVPPSAVEPALKAYPALDALVLQAIAIKRSHRYKTMEEFCSTIRACLAGGAAMPATGAADAGDLWSEQTLLVTPLPGPGMSAAADSKLREPTTEQPTLVHHAAPSRIRRIGYVAVALTAVGLGVGAWLAQRDHGGSRPARQPGQELSARRAAVDQTPATAAAPTPAAGPVAQTQSIRDAAPAHMDGEVVTGEDGAAAARQAETEGRLDVAHKPAREPAAPTASRPRPERKTAPPGVEPAPTSKPEGTVGIKDW